MANRYWVGTGTWNTTSTGNWSATSGGATGASAPTTADDVFFDANSGAGTATLGTSNAKSLTTTGFTGTFTGTGPLTVAGSITLNAGSTWNHTGTVTVTATGTVTSAGKTFGSNFTVNGAGITVTLGSAFATAAALILTQGTLDLGGFTATVATVFSSSNNNTRSVAFGSANIVLTNAVNTTVIVNIDTATNFTCTGTGGFARNSTATSIINIGATIGGAVSVAANVFITGGASQVTINAGSYLKNANFSGSTCTVVSAQVNMCGNLTLGGGAYTTFTPTFLTSGTLTSNGKPINDITVNGAGITLTLADAATVNGALTLTQGTLDLANFTLSCVTFSSNNSNTRSIAFGTGSIALTSTALSVNIISMATATGFTWTGSGLFTRNQVNTASILFGTTAGGTAANAPNLSVTAGSSSLTIDTGNYVKNLDFTGSTCTVSAGAPGFNIAGNLTLATGGTYSTFNPVFIASGTITSVGKSITTLGVNGAGITVTLGDALTVTGTTTLTTGTLDLNSFAFSTAIFSSSNSNTRSVAFGTSNILITSTSASTTIIDIATATGFTYTGAGGFQKTSAGASQTISIGSTAGSVSVAPNLSITAGAASIIINAGSYLKDVVFTGSTATVSGSYNACGNLTLATGGLYTGLSPTFLTSSTVTSNGKTLGATTVNGSGITVTLADNMTLGAAVIFTLTQGTLNLGNPVAFTLSTGIFSSNNANTRAILFGTGNIVLTSTAAATVILDMANATGFNCTGNGGFSRSQGATATITFGTTGGSVSNAPNLFVTGGTFALTITTNSFLRNVIFTGSSCAVTATFNVCGNLTLATGGTYTSVGPTFRAASTFTSNGKNISAATINAPSSTVTLADAANTGSQCNLTEGTLDLNGFTLTTQVFISTNTNTRSVAFGSANILLTSTSVGGTIVSMDTATGFTCTGAGGFQRINSVVAQIVNIGATAGSASVAPNLFITAGAGSITVSTGSYLKNVAFTGSTTSIVATYNACGDLTLATGGTYTNVVPTFLASGTITSVGKPLGATTVNGSGITVTLADALNLGANALTLTQGTFNAATFNVALDSFSSSNTNPRVLSLGSGTWTVSGTGATVWDASTGTNLTVNPGTSTISMTNASAKTFAGGDKSYYNLNQGGAGALTISGSNTFNNITNSTQPATVTFTAGTTQTVSNFGLSGTAGNLITINSSSAGSQFTLSDASGTINAQYLSIQDSNAAGGATWYALTTSGNVDAGNNAGWIFSAAPPTQGGNMFLLFA